MYCVVAFMHMHYGINYQQNTQYAIIITSMQWVQDSPTHKASAPLTLLKEDSKKHSVLTFCTDSAGRAEHVEPRPFML